MPKNIIICCDGTNNKFGRDNSNVVHLCSVLEKNEEQIVYYDPGVGTMADTGFMSPIKKKLSVGMGNAFGLGLQQNVEEAYSFLMEKYEEGDTIYLFGFSRGAFTTRVLTGFIHMMGLLPTGLQNLIPYAYEIYSNRSKKFEHKFKISDGFKKRFSRKFSSGSQKIPIHFLGLWDTVSSVGWIGNFHTYPYTDKTPDVKTIRHAIAIDERRTFFPNHSFSVYKKKKPDLKEVWFSGVHSDVGGSYPEEQSGLSKIALDWMVGEAYHAGVKINKVKYHYHVHGFKIEENRKSTYYKGPNLKADKHESLTGPWWVAEFLPRKLVTGYKPRKVKWIIPRGRRRLIPENAMVHQSVIDRIKDSEVNYNPKNLPSNYIVEKNLEHDL